MIIIYSIVIGIATTLGAVAGLGGGVIIKPLLDVIGYHNAMNISFISRVAVFAMALYATIRHLYIKTKIPYKEVSIIAIGAIIGGNIGNTVFNYCVAIISANILQVAQALSLSILLIITMVSIQKKITYVVTTMYMYFIIGLLLGSVSTFLGIGGGPINVAVFTVFLGVDVKQASIFSLVTILFSQISKLVGIGITIGFSTYDTKVLLYIVPIAIGGGIIGSYYNRRLNANQITRIFSLAIHGILLLNLFVLLKNML